MFARIVTTEMPDIILRELTLSDARAVLAAVQSCPRHLGKFGEPTAERIASLPEAQAFASTCELGHLRFGIWERESFLGCIELWLDTQGRGALSCWVIEARSGKGIASVATAALAKKARALLGCRKLVAWVHPWNRASRRVLEKAGFTLRPERDEKICYGRAA